MQQGLLHILIGAERGGCERCCEALIQYLPDVRHHVLVLARDGPMVPAWRAVGATVDVLAPAVSRSNGRLIAAIEAAVAEHRPAAAVIWHGLIWLPQIVYGLRHADARVGAYGGNPAVGLPPWVEWRYRLLDRYYHVARRPTYVCCSRYVADSYHSNSYMARFPTAVVFNGVELPPGPPAPVRRLDPAGPITVGMLARLDPIKDHATVIRAVARLRQTRFPQVRLEFAGGGGEEARLRALCRECGVEDAVTFHGTVSKVYPVMANWDVFAYATTEREGLGSALAEALMAGLPCVATDVGPIRELCGDGANALLVPPRDPVALADALARVVTDEELRRGLSDRGRAWAEAQFHPTVFAQRYADILLR